MKVIEEYDVELCDDCVAADAGYSEHEMGRPYSTEHPPLSLIMHQEYVLERKDDDPCPFFSSSPCDGCGETLGGNRTDYTVSVFKD